METAREGKKKKEIKKRREPRERMFGQRENERKMRERGDCEDLFKKKTRAAMDLYLKRSITEKCM